MTLLPEKDFFRGRRRRRKRDGPTWNAFSICGILYILQVSMVCSMDGVDGAAVVGSLAGSGVIIRHGRSRGRHSSERRSQQQHPGESNGDATDDISALHFNNQTDKGSAGKVPVDRDADQQQNEGYGPRAEQKIIRLEAAVGAEGLASYHPHPVRFSHKKAMEAKYKILKLTEQGLTNFKWEHQQEEQLKELKLHRKHIVSKGNESIAETQGEHGRERLVVVSRNDVNERREQVTTPDNGSEDSLIGGKQLSPTSGTELQTEKRQMESNGRGIPLEDQNDEPNNRAGTVAVHLVGNANLQNAVVSHATAGGMQSKEGNHNSSMSRNSNDQVPVTHLHSYLFKAMPRKRQPPLLDDGVGVPPQDSETYKLGKKDVRDINFGAVLDDGKEQPNKSISSGAHEQSSEWATGNVIVDGFEQNPHSRNEQLVVESVEVAETATEKAIVIESAKAWYDADSVAEGAVEEAQIDEEHGLWAGVRTEHGNEQIGEANVRPAEIYVTGLRPSLAEGNKDIFNSDNSNLNETKSIGNNDKRHPSKIVTVAGQTVSNKGEEKLNGHKSRKPQRLQEDGSSEKIQEIVRVGATSENVKATTARTSSPLIFTMGIVKGSDMEVGRPLGNDERNNKSEPFADRGRLSGTGSGHVASGRVNESVAVISDGSVSFSVEGERGLKYEEGAEAVTTAFNRENASQPRNSSAENYDVPVEDDPLSQYSGYPDGIGPNEENVQRNILEGMEMDGDAERMGDEAVGAEPNTFMEESVDEEGNDMIKWDDPSRNNRLGLRGGYDTLSRFLQTVEQQHLLGANCTAGTSLNLGEGVVDRYAQERFRIQAEIAVNRANMLTRIFKMTHKDVQVSEQLLHASVLSMIEFDEDIFAAGNCFDFDRHPVQRGLFCPFAHRLSPPSPGMALVKNLADEYHYLDNGSEWFYIARKNAERIIERNEQHVKAYHIYSNSTQQEESEILSVKYEDGRWSKPYYDCGGGNIWMLTYTVPFFGYDHENGSYYYMGTSGIDVDLRRVDIDQCPQKRTSSGVAAPLNIFAGTDKCKQRTTECESIAGMGFRRGSYRCVCQRGFYFPNATKAGQKYFNGSTLEEEYEKQMKGELSLYGNEVMFECLPCAEGCDSCKDASPCIAALNWPMRTSILVMACAIIGFLPPAALFTFKYQQVKVVRAASPALLRVIALGAFFIYCTTIVLYPPPSIYTCTARVWLREIGFSLTYGALMLKTWRISVIFRVRSAKAVKITDASLLKRLGILCGAVGAFLLIRTIVAPPVVIVGRTNDDLKAFLCKTDWWDHTFTSMEVLFLAWGVRLCIMVRKAPSEFNESRFISMAIYNEFLLTCFLNVSMLFLQSPANPDLLFIIFFCHTQLTVTLLLALIFGSKVYLVFRGGGKPDEVIGLGAKPSGAKFICRSQGRTFGNISTATSSTAQLGHYIGTEGRLNEQEAMEEIRNLFGELQRIQERCPPRGLAVATIAAILDSCKFNGTATYNANNNNLTISNINNSLTLKPPPQMLMLGAAPQSTSATTTTLGVHGNNSIQAPTDQTHQTSRVNKATGTADDNISGYIIDSHTGCLANNQSTCEPNGTHMLQAHFGGRELTELAVESRRGQIPVHRDDNERSISQLRKCLQNCPVVSSSSAASSAGDLLLAQHPNCNLHQYSQQQQCYVDYDDMAEENINADTRSSDLDFANLQLECMCSSDSIVSSPNESTYKCLRDRASSSGGDLDKKWGLSGGSTSNNSMQNTGTEKNNSGRAPHTSMDPEEMLEQEVAAVVSYGGGTGGSDLPCPPTGCYSHNIGDDKLARSGNCCQLSAKSRNCDVVASASAVLSKKLLVQKQKSLGTMTSVRDEGLGRATKRTCFKAVSCGGQRTNEGIGLKLSPIKSTFRKAKDKEKYLEQKEMNSRDNRPSCSQREDCSSFAVVATTAENDGEEIGRPTGGRHSPTNGRSGMLSHTKRKEPVTRKFNVIDTDHKSGYELDTGTEGERLNLDDPVYLRQDKSSESISSKRVLEENDARLLVVEEEIGKKSSDVVPQGDDDGGDRDREWGQSKELLNDDGESCRQTHAPDEKGEVLVDQVSVSGELLETSSGDVKMSKSVIETEYEKSVGDALPSTTVTDRKEEIDLPGEDGGVNSEVDQKEGEEQERNNSGNKTKKINNSRNSPDAKLVLDLNDKSKYTKEVSV